MHHSTRRLSVALTIVLSSLRADDVSAAPPAPPSAAHEPNHDEARRHFEQAIALYNDGDYNAALAEFEAAYQAYPSPGVICNIGLTEKALYRYVDAIATLERYLTAAPSAPAERIAEVRRVIAEMRALLTQATSSSPTR